jgi:hypothetical protein
MPIRWSFISFDWDRYRELKIALEPACVSGDFSNLNIPDADDILAEFDEYSDPSEICNTLVLELCGQGESVHFEAGLMELIRDLRRTGTGEDAADLLGSLVSVEPGVEDWWRTEVGLAGLLTAEQTKEIASGLPALARKEPQRPKTRGLAALASKFAPADFARDHLAELTELIDEAIRYGHGLGVMRET